VREPCARLAPDGQECPLRKTRRIRNKHRDDRTRLIARRAAFMSDLK